MGNSIKNNIKKYVFIDGFNLTENEAIQKMDDFEKNKTFYSELWS